MKSNVKPKRSDQYHMTEPITEWEFTADVASWINEILAKNPSLPFFRAKCEQRGSGSNKRRDLTLYDKNKVIILTGEVKLPFAKDGSTPFNEVVVQDARKKAERAGAKHFFTWNVNEFVLWESFEAKTARTERKFTAWNVAEPPIHKASHIENPHTVRAIQLWLAQFLHEFASVLKGTFSIGIQPPDEKFISALESALKMPIIMTLEYLETAYQKSKFKIDIDKWMRDEQGWIIYDDPEGIRENLERVSQFSCYSLVNKLVFHEALLKRYGAKMHKITVPEHIDTAEALRTHLEGFFAEAKQVTRDYETVFGEEHTSIGNRIPFYADSAVPHWRALIDQIHDFDFSKLDYEIIGSIFERLISPEERHKYGQFYTRPEVVDLINSFCIVNGREKVMDPACGGGTFLVRAYARKRELAPERRHGEILTDLYGVDVSHFATHLTTINLATRDLIDDENYPQIARNDFFEVMTHKRLLSLPSKIAAKGLGAIQHRDILVPSLDAVVGNPPYIRQEDIPKASSKKTKGGVQHGTKEYYLDLAKKEAGIELSGRSDIHCYFWTHAATFLKDDGYLCFLTSSQWLDVEYGFPLQEWILKNFEIVAILESIDEPWFVGARVVTTVTILRRQRDEKKRAGNIVRFVQLRQPISEILGHDGTTAGAIEAANAFRDKILSLTATMTMSDYRVRLVRQSELYADGIKLSAIMGEGDRYYGGKWGIHLRAPDFWFDLQSTTGYRWAHLGEIAETKYGVKSGCDDFFYVKDVTQDYIEKFKDSEAFEKETGYERKTFQSGKIKLVLSGKEGSELHAIESKYLEPEVHSLMEIKKYSVDSTDCGKLILLVSGNKEKLKGTHVFEYIRWGEKNNFHRNVSCASRVGSDREWYDLTGHRRAPALWPKEKQYRHIAPANAERLIANCRLYEIYPPENLDDPDLWGGILNSSWVLLSSHQYGRPVGNEGNWSTMVVDVNMMLVPDPRKANKKTIQNVVKVFSKMKERTALYYLSEHRLREMAYRQAGKEAELDSLSDECELDMPDRRELDDAVLELLGIESNKQRDKLIDELHAYLRQFFELVRRKEEKAIANKNRAKRREKVTPTELADQILKEIEINAGYLLKSYQSDFLDASAPFDTFDIPAAGTPEAIVADMFTTHGVRFKKGKKELAFVLTKNAGQDELIVFLSNAGIRGLTRVPHKGEDAHHLLEEYSHFVHERDERLRELIEQRTSDEDIQEKVFDILLSIIHHRH